jgi:hypothetical protein
LLPKRVVLLNLTQWICAAQLQRQSDFDIRSPMARRFSDPFRAAMVSSPIPGTSSISSGTPGGRKD